MKSLSLFSGIGGIDLACGWAGISTVAFCEREPFPQKVLQKNWPGIPIYDDVCTLTKERLEEDGIGTVDLIHGGYPCQPFSLAGNREGTDDDRHLWPEVFRLIQALQPRWFVGENVAGHITLGLDIVLSDLDSIGYSAETFVIPAVAVNARHRRDRVFIVAYSNSFGNVSSGEYRIDRNGQKEVQQRFKSFLGLSNQSKDVSDSAGEGLQKWGRPELSEGVKETRAGMVTKFERCSEDVSNTMRKGLQGREEAGNISTSRTKRNEQFTGCDPCGTNWAVEPNVGRVANGVPNRVDRLKALGNAVVPQQIYPIIAAIKQIDDMMRG